MSYEVTLDALGRSYSIPEAGQTNYVNDLSLYLRDLATVVNDTSGGGLISPVFNVKTYGATGNGATDDTVAINLAMAALRAASASGGTLYFPAGSYVTSSTLQFGVASAQSGVQIVGDGANSSTIKPTGAFSTTPVVEFRDSNYWSMSAISVDASARTGSGDNVLVDGSSYGVLTNCHILNSKRYGVNIAKINGALTSTYNVVNQNVFSGNTTANTNVTVTSATIGNVANSITGIFPGPGTVDVQSRFGVAANGTTDDTAACQAAFDWAYTEINSNQRVPVLLFPAGDIKITATLVVKGNSSASPTLLGAVPYGSAAFNTPNTRFVWHGADSGTMVYFQSFNKGTVQGIHCMMNDKAACGFHFAASLYSSPSTLAASSGWTVDACRVANAKPGITGSACVWIGTDSIYTGGGTYQSSEGVFRRCNFVGESNGAVGFTWAGIAASGIRTLQGGNCKNFAVYDCNFSVGKYAIDWAFASGNFNVFNFNAGEVETGIRQGDGHLTVIGGDVESNQVTDFKFLTGSGGGGDCSAEIFGVEASGQKPAANQFIIEWGGHLHLVGCVFNAILPDLTTQIPIKVLAATSGANSLTSYGNWFSGATTWAPFYDGSGNAAFPEDPTTFSSINPLRVRSWGDKGGLYGAGTPTPLNTFDSNPNTYYSARFNGLTSFQQSTWANADASLTLQTLVNVKQYVMVDATSPGGTKTINLPTAVGNRGIWYSIKKIDSTSNTVTIDPFSTQTIDGASTLVLAAQGDAVIVVSDNANWHTVVPAAVRLVGAQTIAGAKTFSAPIIHSAVTGITAFATGGQASATALTTDVNFVTVCATNGDSVKLPTAILGLEITVFNQGAANLDIFPVTGGQIDALGANAAYSLASGSSKAFYGKSATDYVSR